MKQKLWRFVVLGALAFSALTHSASALDREMARFAAEKEAQTREFAEAQPDKVPSIVWSFFDAVRVDDWETATNLFAKLQIARGFSANANTNLISPALQSAVWPPIVETLGTYEVFHDWNNQWLHRFGRELMGAIPKRSILFGGNAAGRYVASAFSESHREGEPFFTLTQNQLADGTYLEYLRKMYGAKISLPTPEEAQNIFQDYLADAQQRLKTGKLKPGEDVRVVDNQVQLSGHVAVMEINGRLAQAIWKKNPDREFFVVQSFPLDWMFPYLSPSGLIFKLNPAPLAALSAESVEKNQEYWKRFMGELVGDWINDKTSVPEICDFAEKIYLQKNLKGFKGDPGFARSREAQECFGKLRGDIAGLYAWRAAQTIDADEKKRMQKAADLAFRQAFVLNPTSAVTVFSYGSLLISLKSNEDAVALGKTCLRIAPDNANVADLVNRLRTMR